MEQCGRPVDEMENGLLFRKQEDFDLKSFVNIPLKWYSEVLQGPCSVMLFISKS